MAKHIVIVGATASGKSQVAIDIAKTPNFDEIISLDSMQIYKGMEIGTGVVPQNEREGIVHHLISQVEPTEDFNVKKFQVQIYALLESNPKKRYVFVGGTGLYTHAVIDGFSFAPADENVREEIIDKYDLDENNPDFNKVAKAYELLQKLDYEAAQKIDPKNVRRIIRALEAIELSGTPFSQTGIGVQNFGDPKISVDIYGLRYSRENLKKRISSRVDLMFDQGWIEEVRSLTEDWPSMVAPARKAIGYTPIYEWIKSGEIESDLEDLKSHIVNKTMQFSRRQRKWFERDPRISWIDCDELDRESIVDLIVKKTSS